jgi:putative ABC transport system substrate-binding protein
MEHKHESAFRPPSGWAAAWGGPISQPTNYELGLNLKTAKELGIAVPPSLLVQANEVVE